MSRYDLSPAQWRMLERIRKSESEWTELNGAEFRTSMSLETRGLVEWVEMWEAPSLLCVTQSGRIALRLKKKLDALEAGR